MSNFFEQLLKETEQERNEFLNIDFLKHGVRGEINIDSYIAFLIQAYHHVKHTTPLLMACGSRITSDKEWLRDAMAHYIEEEVGHQEWILNDITACGGDAEEVRHSTPGFSAEVMCSYAYNIIDRGNPVGFLGMVLVLEGTSINLATEASKNLCQNLGLPESAFSYLSSHGSLDISHMEFYSELVNRIENETDQKAIIHYTKQFYRLYGNIFKDLPLELNKSLMVA
ncbi:MAG: iron-containing redox enzyme family protein [Gammaproteobacteria bacterium]|nr:iron-containing redox enzyme family protein [Gammaproteobacteria bacterium]